MAAAVKKGEKGFTLIEMLTVLAIISIIAAVATVSVSKTLKKQRLEAAANQLQSFIESASVHARERSCGVFVWLHRGNSPQGGSQWWYCYLIADTNRDDILDYNLANPWEEPPGAPSSGNDDRYLRTERIQLPDDLVLSPAGSPLNPGPVWPGPNNWPAHPAIAGDFLMLCDPRGLPFDPNGPNQIMGPTVISITHQEMVNEDLHPKIRHDITISALWHTRQESIMY